MVFHFIGSDASTCLISGCNSVHNYGWGFTDQAGVGNTYVGCHAENDLGLISDGADRDYKNSAGGTNAGVYMGCYTDSGTNELWFPAVVIDSMLSDANPGRNLGDATLLDGNVVGGRALQYYNKLGPEEVQIEFGQRDGNGGVLNFALPARDYSMLTWEPTTGWWGLDNSSPNGRTSIRFPTTVAMPRRTAPLFSNGIFYGSSPFAPSLGPGASEAITNNIAGTEIPTSGTWEKGDVVWNRAPVPGGTIGWVCTTKGTNGTLNGGLTTGSIAESTTLTVSVTTDLVQWQYITIEDVIYQIVSAPALATMVITPGAVNAIAPGTAINAAGAPPVVVTAYFVSKGATKVKLSRAGVLTAGQSITFGNEPDVYTIVTVVNSATVDIDRHRSEARRTSRSSSAPPDSRRSGLSRPHRRLTPLACSQTVISMSGISSREKHALDMQGLLNGRSHRPQSARRRLECEAPSRAAGLVGLAIRGHRPRPLIGRDAGLGCHCRALGRFGHFVKSRTRDTCRRNNVQQETNTLLQGIIGTFCEPSRNYIGGDHGPDTEES